MALQALVSPVMTSAEERAAANVEGCLVSTEPYPRQKGRSSLPRAPTKLWSKKIERPKEF